MPPTGGDSAKNEVVTKITSSLFFSVFNFEKNNWYFVSQLDVCHDIKCNK